MTLRQIENQLDGKLFDGERKSRLTPLGSFTLKQAKIAVETHRCVFRPKVNTDSGLT